ncbi:MAG: FAD-dependent oxidoreductase [Candidatus Omnitrophica bacterium]|nr:FAD-dependent oxidoreductase [Candidatus Omnitrophota bacterium]
MKRVAVIGTGIAGMGAGYYLRDRCHITFYEKEPRPGGHTNTVVAREAQRDVPIDTGFMVYNEKTYPNFVRLLKELEVATEETSMSFSVQHLPSGLEYRGTDQLFARRRNLLNFPYIAMLLEIDRFRRQAVEVIADDRYAACTVEEYAREKGYRKDFLDQFLIPMSSAVWSIPAGKVLDFPVRTLVRFFHNHGFLGLNTQLQWRTIIGGSRVYRDRLLNHFTGRVRLGMPVKRVSRTAQGVEVEDASGQRLLYDKAVLACHADEALSLLEGPTSRESALLGAFSYQKNRAVLHTDASPMPKVKRAWASWNYRVDKGPQGHPAATTVYYMNSLQGVSDRQDYFVSINDPGLIARDKIIWEKDYHHPVFNMEAVNAQGRLAELNKNGRVYYCGSYFGYGFHEDALTSALNVAGLIAGGQ